MGRVCPKGKRPKQCSADEHRHQQDPVCGEREDEGSLARRGVSLAGVTVTVSAMRMRVLGSHNASSVPVGRPLR